MWQHYPASCFVLSFIHRHFILLLLHSVRYPLHNGNDVPSVKPSTPVPRRLCSGTFPYNVPSKRLGFDVVSSHQNTKT